MRATVIALTLLLALPASLTSRADNLTLLYSGNLDGELEPCGCTLDTDFGGIQRRATFVDQQREQNPQLVLISSGGLFSPEMGSDQIKHRFILTGLAQLNYDAVGLQWTDLTHGPEFLKQVALPFSAANWIGSEFPRSRLIERNGHKIRYLQWLDPATSPYASMPALSPITPDSATLAAELQKAEAAGELTMVATTLDLEQARAQLPLNQIDLLIIGSAYELFSEPVALGNGPLVLQPGSRGQRMGKLTLDIADGRITGWNHLITELPDSVPSAARLDAWYQAYNDALREDYEQRVAQRQQLDSGDSPYLGADQCQSCHSDQFRLWQTTDHARAFEDLEIVGKAFDSHCVGCHVVGFNQPGGYLDITLTDHLAGVQCENCHGGGREHAESAGQVATLNKEAAMETLCMQCHVKEHSPQFNVETYWPRIAHPLSR
ncbi:multiheme c-type cytochrome [Motiliproteus sediminis]|uniref:multiheme c-type cytochrome n=1 Tax=Motiliproteus sediminis TaxID=1468178 RepID=UPI001AEFC681|nr:multiheme c-type cytochrome [Motiliproteus sediminis]